MMIAKIQGSTQMPSSIQQSETEPVETRSKKDNSELGEGSLAPFNDKERTAPPPQRANPAAERKLQADALAMDLNVQFNTISGDKPNPPNSNPVELENTMVTSFNLAPEPSVDSAQANHSKNVPINLYDLLISSAVDRKETETEEGASTNSKPVSAEDPKL